MCRCVVTFAKGPERYTKALDRLKESFRKYGVDVLAYTNESQLEGCPQHSEVPYAFKAYAIEQALLNYDTVLWCDSVVYAKGDPAPVFEWIEKNGTMLFNNIGFTVGGFTNDECLRYFGITRDRAKQMPMIMACVMGVQKGRFVNRYVYAAKYGNSPYVGSWEDHRHDQSVASILANDYNIKLLTGHETFFTYEDHPGMQPVNKSVILYSK